MSQANTWIGTRVRKENLYGTVIGDANSAARVLTIRMDDGSQEVIIMSNIGDDPSPEELAKWEWHWDSWGEPTWYRFNPMYTPPLR